MRTTREALFTVAPTAAKMFEKRAAALSRVPDDVQKWPQQVLSEMLKEMPYLANYDVDIVLDRTEPEAGAAFGYAQVRNKTMSRPQDNVSTPGNIIRIPILVQDRRLQKFYVFECGKQTYPLTEERVREALLNPSVFDTDVTTVPVAGSLIEQLFPPYQQRRGFGRVAEPSALGLEKINSAPVGTKAVDAAKQAAAVFGAQPAGGRDTLGDAAMSDAERAAEAQQGSGAPSDPASRWRAVIANAQQEAAQQATMAQQQAAAEQPDGAGAQGGGGSSAPKKVDGKDVAIDRLTGTIQEEMRHRHGIENALLEAVTGLRANQQEDVPGTLQDAQQEPAVQEQAPQGIEQVQPGLAQEKVALSPELIDRALLNRADRVNDLLRLPVTEQGSLLAQRTADQAQNIHRMQRTSAPSIVGSRPAVQGGGILSRPQIAMPVPPVTTAAAAAEHVAPEAAAAAEHAAPTLGARAGEFLAEHGRTGAALGAGILVGAVGLHAAHRLLQRPQEQPVSPQQKVAGLWQLFKEASAASQTKAVLSPEAVR